MEDHEFLTGNGVGGPLGILNAGAAYEVARTTASTIVFDDIVAMLSRLLRRGGAPVWMASQSIMPKLLALRNLSGSPAIGDGALVYQPSLQPGIPDMLLGYPVIWHERSPQLGTAGDLVLADLSYYLIKDGSGPFVASSEHVKFRENKTVFKIFWNVDGQPWLTAPFKQEGGYEVSPFVALGDVA
jgi:HK97 family phage major capsid protein